MTSIFTLQYYVYALLFNCVCCSAVTLLVLGIKRDSKVIKLFAMFTGEIAVWAFFYWASLVTEDAVVAELLFRTCMVPVVVIPASFFHFITELTNVRISKKIHYANYSLSLLLLLTIYTPVVCRNYDGAGIRFSTLARAWTNFPDSLGSLCRGSHRYAHDDVQCDKEGRLFGV
jgi:hypothetical protein